MGPIGLDFGTMLAMGDAMGADRRMLAELLPAVEGEALAMVNGQIDDIDEEEGGNG